MKLLPKIVTLRKTSTMGVLDVVASEPSRCATAPSQNSASPGSLRFPPIFEKPFPTPWQPVHLVKNRILCAIPTTPSEPPHAHTHTLILINIPVICSVFFIEVLRVPGIVHSPKMFWYYIECMKEVAGM